MLNFIHPSVYIMIDEVIHGGEWRVEIVLFGAQYASVCPSRESMGGFLLSFED